MSLLQKPASSTETTASCTATATEVEPPPCASHYVNATCVGVEDMGVIDTRFGKKPMLKFTFETNQINEYGQRRRLTRLFHKHFHPLSTLSLTAKTWCERDLAAEKEATGDVDLETFVDSPARIKLEPGTVKDGKCYDKITEILPPDEEKVETNCEPEDGE